VWIYLSDELWLTDELLSNELLSTDELMMSNNLLSNELLLLDDWSSNSELDWSVDGNGLWNVNFLDNSSNGNLWLDSGHLGSDNGVGSDWSEDLIR
jgi:hypothetical protein